MHERSGTSTLKMKAISSETTKLYGFTSQTTVIIAAIVMRFQNLVYISRCIPLKQGGNHTHHLLSHYVTVCCFNLGLYVLL